MTNRINFSVIPFPQVQFSGDIAQLAQFLAEHLQGDMDQSVFTGQNGGTAPATDVGVWLDGDVWKHWYAPIAKYVPFSLVTGKIVGADVKLVALVATNNENIILNLPSTSGTLALAAGHGINGADETDTQASNTINLDWTAKNIYAVISGAATIVDAGGGVDTQEVFLYVETPISHAVALTLTPPAAWRQTGITLSTTDATHRAVDLFKISRIGSDTFITKVNAFQINQAGAGGDTTPPTFVSANVFGGTAQVNVVFSELIKGTSTPANWVVRKGAGLVQTISSVKITNNKTILSLATPVNSDEVATVQYLGGGSVQDLAANAAVAFGPSAVDVTVST